MARCMFSACAAVGDVAAVLEQAFERLEQLVAAAVRRRARRSAAGGSGRPARVPQVGDQRPAAELVVGGDRARAPAARARTARRSRPAAAPSGASSSEREGRADAAGRAGVRRARRRGASGRGRGSRAGRPRGPGDVGGAAAPAQALGDRLAVLADRDGERRRSPASAASAARSRGVRAPASSALAACSRVRRWRSSAARWRPTGCPPTSSPPRASAGALGVGERPVADDHPQEAEQHVAVADRQAAAPGHPERRRCAARRRGRAPAAARARRARRPRPATSRASGSRSAGPRRPRRAARCARAAASAGPRPRSAAGSRPRGRRRSPAGRPRVEPYDARDGRRGRRARGSAGSPPRSSCSAAARRVPVLEAEGVGAGQSAGLARIFRIAHARPAAVRAGAGGARAAGATWERELGAARCWATRGSWSSARERADRPRRCARPGAPRRAARRARRDRGAACPLLPSDHAWGGGIWDPLAGVDCAIQRALDALAARRRRAARHA